MPTPIRVPESGPSEIRFVVRLTLLEWKLLARMAGVPLDKEGKVKRRSTYEEPTIAGYVREQLSLLPAPRNRRR